MATVKLKDPLGNVLTYNNVGKIRNVADGVQNIFSEGMSGANSVTFKSKNAYSDPAYSNYSIVSIKTGEKVGAPPAPTVTGGAVNGWTTDSSGSGTLVTFPYTVNADATFYAIIGAASSILNENSWATISSISGAGTGANFWSVGDVKMIHIQGTAGSMTLNDDLGVFILGFNHNSTLEGTGISFGCFTSATSNSKGSYDRCLVDSGYNSSKSSGTWNNMNNSNTNVGGWMKSRMRYYLLGSTDTENGQASSTTATNPVSNTLMSCFPSDLRAVMKPIIKYTDNTGGSSSSAAAVTLTIDYLPLLAEYEVFGARTYANTNESAKQAQYAYYVSSAASKKQKYKYNGAETSAYWWLRSAYSGITSHFCRVSTSGAADGSPASYSSGVAPGFLI